MANVSDRDTYVKLRCRNCSTPHARRPGDGVGDCEACEGGVLEIEKIQVAVEAEA